MKISREAATATQLANFATTFYGLDVDLRMGKDKLLAALDAVGHAGDIEVDGGSAPAAAPISAAAPEPADPKVKIIIPLQEGVIGGMDDVKVGVNGRHYLIKRDVEANVPKSVINVLRDAKQLKFERGPNGEPINPRLVPRFPFQTV